MLDMNGLELFLLGRTLMKIAEAAIPAAGSQQLPATVRSVLLDVFEHPESSIGEIAARTGFPQSHVSAAVARLRALGGALETTVDPRDRRRTLVRPAPEADVQAGQPAAPPVERALAAALGTDDPREIAAVVAGLEDLARRLTPQALARIRAALAAQQQEGAG
jgi:DNA-binding MarR family transcriptional regulator